MKKIFLVALILYGSSNNLLANVLENECNQSQHDYERYYLFLSQSIPVNQRQNIYEDVQGKKNITIVYQGISSNIDATIGEGIFNLQRETVTFKSGLNVILNPNLFIKYNIQVVPSIVAVDCNDKIFAKVAGIESVDWFEKSIYQIKNRKYDDFNHKPFWDYGIKGPVYNIKEINLIDVMKHKFLSIDWHDKLKDNLNNFWHKQSKFSFITHTNKFRKFKFAPTYTLKQDIKTDSDTVLFFKGSSLNPLNYKNFDRTLIVFSPHNKNELNTIKNFLDNDQPKNPILIITHIDDWESFNQLVDVFNHPIFLLNNSIIECFKILHTPSIIFQNQNEPLLTLIELGD